MAKLILSLDDHFISEYLLDQARTSIGRRPSNDIHIDNLAVSGEHAAILQVGNDFYMEDLASTNGTIVNDAIVDRHLLQHADLIEIGKYKLKFISPFIASSPSMDSNKPDFQKTIIVRPAIAKATVVIAEATAVDALTVNAIPTPVAEAVPASHIGRIQVLNGSSIGRELVLNKALTTLGKTGVQVAVITKRADGYFITHVEGQVFPILNGASTGVQAYALSDHDVIELAGVKMEFYLS
jgi:pSer/pThr/pTyr-binding forkhead associated (FHA) protein